MSTTRAVYTVPEMAEILGMSPQIVRQHLRAGEMPGRRIGGVWLVHRPTFDAWVETYFGEKARSA